MGGLIDKIEKCLAMGPPIDEPAESQRKTRSVYNVIDAELGNVVEEMQYNLDGKRKIYQLDFNELHLLEMAERRFVRIKTFDGVETVWRWIARRSKVDFDSISMIPGTQKFKAIPVNN